MAANGFVTKKDLMKYFKLVKRRKDFKGRLEEIEEQLCEWECAFKGREQEVLKRLSIDFEELPFDYNLYREFLHDHFLYGTPEAYNAIKALENDEPVKLMKRRVGITGEMERRAQEIMGEIR